MLSNLIIFSRIAFPQHVGVQLRYIFIALQNFNVSLVFSLSSADPGPVSECVE